MEDETRTQVDAEHIADVVALLTRDLEATGLGAHAGAVDEVVAHVAAFIDDTACFTAKVVEDVQQAFHDCRVDTVWPRCPRHSRHPLWLHDGVWVCEQDDVAIAPLGALSRAGGTEGSR